MTRRDGVCPRCARLRAHAGLAGWPWSPFAPRRNVPNGPSRPSVASFGYLRYEEARSALLLDELAVVMIVPNGSRRKDRELPPGPLRSANAT